MQLDKRDDAATYVTRPLRAVLGLSVLLPLIGAASMYLFLGAPKWEHEPIHSAMEAAGSAIALVLGYLLLRNWHRQSLSGGRDREFLWIATALLCMGLMDAIHATVSVNTALSWTRTLATFLGGVCFSLVWLPSRLAKRWIPATASLGTILLGTLVVLFSDSLPLMIGPEGYYPAAKAINLIGGIGFLFAAAYFIRSGTGEIRNRNLLFASLCILFGLAGLLFSISHMWGSVWWFFHLLRLSAYLVLLRFLVAWFDKAQEKEIVEVKAESLAQVRLERERLERIFMEAPTPIAVHEGPEHRIVFLNRACRQLFGESYSQALGKSAREMMPKGDLVIAQFDRVYRNGETVIHEEVPVTFALNREGMPEVRYFRSVFQPTYDSSNAITGLITYTIELTEQVLARKRLEETGAALQKAVQARDEFLSIASHELRTPITSLRMQLQITQKLTDLKSGKFPSPERIARTIEVSMRQVDRLTKMVEDVLDISRIREGKMGFKFARVQVRKMVEEVVDRHLEELKAAGCPIHIGGDGLVEIDADPIRIEQVIQNLLSNAMKYGAGKAVEISLSHDATAARIAVRDSGIGIPKEKQEVIFERFERAVSHDKISGWGLGLYISKQIVDAHHGNISIESELGRGSTFVVEIPLRQPPGSNLDASGDL